MDEIADDVFKPYLAGFVLYGQKKRAAFVGGRRAAVRKRDGPAG